MGHETDELNFIREHLSFLPEKGFAEAETFSKRGYNSRIRWEGPSFCVNALKNQDSVLLAVSRAGERWHQLSKVFDYLNPPSRSLADNIDRIAALFDEGREKDLIAYEEKTTVMYITNVASDVPDRKKQISQAREQARPASVPPPP